MRCTSAAFLSVLAGIALAMPSASAQGSRQEALEALRALNATVTERATDACNAVGGTRADQVMRLHTQVMVTGLACAEVYGDTNLELRYRQFTAIQAEVILTAQAEIIRSLGGGDQGQERFDAYRTGLANEEAQLMNEVATGRYCAMRRSRFDTLLAASPAAFTNYASDLAARAAFRRAGCR